VRPSGIDAATAAHASLSRGHFASSDKLNMRVSAFVQRRFGFFTMTSAGTTGANDTFFATAFFEITADFFTGFKTADFFAFFFSDGFLIVAALLLQNKNIVERDDTHRTHDEQSLS
jgi:hypothetical protein